MRFENSQFEQFVKLKFGEIELFYLKGGYFNLSVMQYGRRANPALKPF